MKVATIVLSVLLVGLSSASPLGRRNSMLENNLVARDSYDDTASANQLYALVHPVHKRQVPTSPEAIRTMVMQFLKPQGVPQAMLDLIQAAPDSVFQGIISQPADKLKGVIADLKAGKIPAVPGQTPKQLIVAFLPGLGVPQSMIELIKSSPDVLVSQITALTIDKLGGVINDLKAGKIPTVPGIAPKNFIVQFLGGNGVPQNMLDLIKALPDSIITQIQAIPADKLPGVIADLKAGKIPNLPAPAASAPVASTPVASTPATMTPAASLPMAAVPVASIPTSALGWPAAVAPAASSSWP
ncbi:hypothetical protein ABW20_dc0108455 [Dactylellina cionopaga]|nr:hypothetical protein ABW20_dc0108455 [Dactylellina cionopaga]